MSGIGGKATGKGAADIQKLRKTVYFSDFEEKTEDASIIQFVTKWTEGFSQQIEEVYVI